MSVDLNLIAFAIEIMVLVVGVVWVFGKMSGAVRVLESSLEGLKNSITRLSSSVDDLDNKIDTHSDRLARLEERSSSAT